MERHPALQDLSRDHHHVLFRCQRLRRLLAAPGPWDQLRPLVEEFLVFYDSDMSPHFREEDDLVVPAARRHASLQGVADRTLREHGQLRTDIETLRSAAASEPACRDILARLEPVITGHVRMEEEILFRGVQEALKPEELEALRRRSHEFRRLHRAADASGPRAGRG